jgi:hypothetical protein
MTPVDSYNSQVNFPEIVKGVQNNKTLEVSDQCLLLFGNGDGGGGPTAWMLEKVGGFHQSHPILIISSKDSSRSPLRIPSCPRSKPPTSRTFGIRSAPTQIMVDFCQRGEESYILSFIEG